MSTILVSDTSYRKARSTFERLSKETGYLFLATDEREIALAEAIKANNIKAFIADIHPYKDQLYTALPEGGVIARYGVGHDSIDKEKATANGLHVANTPGVLDNAVAEHACWMIGNTSRHLHTLHSSTISGNWQPVPGVELLNRKVAILGFGRIGQNLCRKLAIGFGMNVTAVDVLPEDSFFDLRSNLGFSKYTQDRESAIADADYVILLMAVLPQTRHIVNQEFLSKMKSSSILINSARGALVCENDLYDALEAGTIAAAGLDVFETEPYAPQHPEKDLRTLNNLLLTPHIGSNTAESNAAMATMAAQNVITILEKGPDECPNIVNR